MALIRCKNCGHLISERAKVCPKCGAKNIIDKPQTPYENAALSETENPANDQVDEIVEDYLESTKKSKAPYIILIIILSILLGGCIAYLLYADHQNKMAQARHQEQLRQDSIAAAQLEAARLDSIRRDSIERRNFTTPDLVFAELHGKVKSCVFKNRWCPINQIYEFKFDMDGNLINGKKFHRDKYNQIIEDSYSDPELADEGVDGTISKYTWKDGKIIRMKYIYGPYSNTYSYKYNMDGTLKSVVNEFMDEFSPEESRFVRSSSYTNYKFDNMGNWIKRTHIEDGQSITETRVIKYYD